MGQEQRGSSLWDRVQESVLDISKECVACGTQQPGRMVLSCCWSSDALGSLQQTECFEYLAVCSLVVVTN